MACVAIEGRSKRIKVQLEACKRMAINSSVAILFKVEYFYVVRRNLLVSLRTLSKVECAHVRLAQKGAAAQRLPPSNVEAHTAEPVAGRWNSMFHSNMASRRVLWLRV